MYRAGLSLLVGRAVPSRLQAASLSSAPSVSRPPHYRKPHQHHTPKHMLQEEFPNAGDASGAGVRLFDYQQTAEMVARLPTIREKIDFVSPFERPWTQAEKTWRRDWHPSLMATRKAWGVPASPTYFDCLRFYQYVTKTRMGEGSLDQFYEGLNPPTESYQHAMEECLSSILSSTRFDSEEERVSVILAALVDEAALALAHNVHRLADYRTSYGVQSESFWVRSGFMFLYDEKEIGGDEVSRKLNRTQKYIGDDRRKLGELAFVSRDHLAAQIRSKEAPAPLFSLENEKATLPVFPEEVNVSNDILFSPKVFNLWPDEQPLWQCPGYFVESEETHTYGRLAAKSLVALDTRCDQWNLEGEERSKVWAECATAQAVASLFTTLNAQAHTHGFTQYTDVTRAFSSQMILSNGCDFVFAAGQLNTIAINIEVDGFVNDRSNVVFVDAPLRLYDDVRDGQFYHGKGEAEEKGLNPVVLKRIMQMVMRQ